MSWWTNVGSDAASDSGSTVTPKIDAQPQSGGFDWGAALNLGANVLGNVLPAVIGNQGADKAADAARAGNQAAIDLQRQIYQDQVSRSEPWRKSGFNALNFLNQWNGLPQVTDSGGAVLGSVDPNAPNASNNWGAGRPVAGHTGGGGPNALTGAAGSAIGTVFGGPVGGFIGGALGGLVRNGGDNWTTLATGAPEGFDYNAYMAQNPGLAAEWAKPDVQSLFNGNRDAYAYWHYNKFGPSGKNEGWQLNTLPGYESANGGLPTKSTQPVGGTTLETPGGSSGQSDLWSTITNNPLYVAARDGFLGVNGQGGDVSAIKGAFATNGQALSGSALKALQDRSVSRSYGALSDIYGNIAGTAGVGATTANQQNANAGAFGANAGGLLSENGQIAGNASAIKNSNWLKAGQGALAGAYDIGKSAGWLQ